MKLVVVVGAGASVAEAASHRPVQTLEHPPLDTNFFSKAEELGDPPFRSTLEGFARRAGIPNPFGSVEPRMEEFFGDIYFELTETSGRDHERALEAYRALLRLYGRVLAVTTNWMHDRARGVMGKYLRLVTRPPVTDLTFVTFNHDLILENGLAQLPYRTRWCVEEGYGPIPLKHATTVRAVPELPTHSDECDHSLPIQVLKLHGSLNWGVETLSHDPSYKDLFPPATRAADVLCIPDRVVSVNLSRRKGTRLWRLWPQIVPPVYNKQEIIAARFGTLWRAASEALEGAEHIAVIGYSMPQSDIHGQNLIRRAIRRNTAVAQIDVVNPDPNVVVRLTKMGDVPSVLWHRSFADYVARLSSAA